MIEPSKRLLIKRGLLAVFGLTHLLPVFYQNTIAKENSIEYSMKSLNTLIETLKSINHPVCLQAANTLAALKSGDQSYDLHLRRADLNKQDVNFISEAIGLTHANSGPSLQSFSMSYNDKIGNEGILNLLKVLPSSVTEIGLVQCAISDEAGKALISWAEKAPRLHWLCVEKNLFSKRMKQKFIALGNQRNGLLVVV